MAASLEGNHDSLIPRFRGASFSNGWVWRAPPRWRCPSSTACSPFRETLKAGATPAGVLSATEAATLAAICARIIPTDENGPGAAEARASVYIDRALGGWLAPSREAYTAGLAAIDDAARAQRREAICRSCAGGAGRRAYGRSKRRRSLRWCGRTRYRARSAIRHTAATRTSSAGI